jgi:PIN domain nuclease of toxin-antitoxin system
MRPQLLDTHILQWYLTGDTSLHASIRNDIDYYANTYRVSMESLKELVVLRGLGKVSSYLTLDYVCTKLEERAIGIEPVRLEHVYCLEGLRPVVDQFRKRLRDPVDRMLVAQAISMRYTLISGDHFFPLYRDQGLEVINGRTAERHR